MSYDPGAASSAAAEAAEAARQEYERRLKELAESSGVDDETARNLLNQQLRSYADEIYRAVKSGDVSAYIRYGSPPVWTDITSPTGEIMNDQTPYSGVRVSDSALSDLFGSRIGLDTWQGGVDILRDDEHEFLYHQHLIDKGIFEKVIQPSPGGSFPETQDPWSPKINTKNVWEFPWDNWDIKFPWSEGWDWSESIFGKGIENVGETIGTGISGIFSGILPIILLIMAMRQKD